MSVTHFKTHKLNPSKSFIQTHIPYFYLPIFHSSSHASSILHHFLAFYRSLPSTHPILLFISLSLIHPPSPLSVILLSSHLSIHTDLHPTTIHLTTTIPLPSFHPPPFLHHLHLHHSTTIIPPTTIPSPLLPPPSHPQSLSLSFMVILRLLPSSGVSLKAVWETSQCADEDLDMLMCRHPVLSYTWCVGVLGVEGCLGKGFIMKIALERLWW